MSFQYLTSTVGGLYLYVEDESALPPTSQAPKGAICVNTVIPATFQNTNGGTGWEQVSSQAGFWLSKTYNAADGVVTIPLPPRAAGWKVIDAYIVSSAAGGTVILQRDIDAAPLVDVLVRGAAAVITRAAQCFLLTILPSGSGAIRLTTAGGGAGGGTAFVLVLPV